MIKELAFSHRNTNYQAYCWYRCFCGKTFLARQTSIRIKNTRSCGCLYKNNGFKHGKYRTPAYISWMSMKQRCINPEKKYYFGKGIKVCHRWMKFENFFKDMGIRPKGKTIDRINPNGNYTPSNCRWASAKTQVHNRKCMLKR